MSTCKDSVMGKREIHSILNENEHFFGECSQVSPLVITERET